MFGRLILSLIFSFLPAMAIAGETVLYKPVPDWVIPAPAPASLQSQPSGTPTVIFDEQQRLDEAGRWEYVEQVMRADSTETIGEIGTVTLQWNPAKGDLIVHRAEIIRESETIDLVAKGARLTVLRREEQLEMLEITGILTATMNVEGLRVGDLLRVAYSVTSKDPALREHVEVATDLIAEPVKPSFARLRLLWPTGRQIRWKATGKMPEVRVVKKGPFNELSISAPLPKQPEVPASAPPRFHRRPMIEASSFADWAEVSNVEEPLYRTSGLIEPGSPLAAEVKKIVAATPDPRRRTALALQLVQDKIRYLAVAMGDGNYVPQAPARTWESRFGDCKAKTLLLLALLHAMDIKAEPVLADVGIGDALPDRLPAFGAFDHVLVRAEIQGTTLWLDGTGSGTRYEDLEDAPGLSYVLPLRAEGASLLPIATRASARPDFAAELEVDQSAGINFPAPYKASFVLRGAAVEALRASWTRAELKERRDLVVGLAGPFINNGSVVTFGAEFDDDAGLVSIEATGLSNFRWPKANGHHEFTIGNFYEDRLPKQSGSADWQKHPVRVQYPFHYQMKMRFKLPDYGGPFLLQGGEPLADTTAGFDMATNVSLDGQWLAMDVRMAARDKEIPVDKIPQTLERVAAMRSHNPRVLAPADYPARWQETSLAKASGRFAPIYALLDKDINTFPDEAMLYRNRATMLAGIYERRKAVADLGEVIKREPQVAVYLSRSRLLADLGDTNAAKADLDAARVLDPGSDVVLSLQAQLHVQQGRFEDALKLLEGRIALGGKEKIAYQAGKADVLNRSGRADEAFQLLDAIIAENPGNPQLLNGRCWARGLREIALDQALKDCTKSIELADNAFPALHSRALVYFRLKRFDEAMADLTAADVLAPGSAQMLYLRGIIKKAMGDRSSTEDIAAARMMWPRVGEEYQVYGLVP